MRVSHLFVVTAIVELCAGVALVAIPSTMAILLLGSPLGDSAGLIVARVAGVALVALGVTCVQARRDEHSAAAKAIILGLTVYNVAIVLLLVLVAAVMRIAGGLLWPTVLLHTAMTVWCVGARRRADMASALSSYRRRVVAPRSK